MNYQKELAEYALGVLQKIISGDKGYDDSDLRDCLDALYGGTK